MGITASQLVAKVAVEGDTEAKSKLSGFGQAVAAASDSVKNGMLGSVKNMAGGFLNFGAQLGQTIIGFKGLYDGAISLGSALLAPNASMEQTTVAFETLLGKGKQTQAFLQQMKDFAAATPFEFPEVATAAQHMLAFGFSAKQVIPTLTNIGDAMGSMGKGAADIDHIVEIFGQMHAAGKLNAGDMMQLADEGIPAWNFLAQAMGKTVPEVQKLTTQGLVPADTAIKAVSDGMHKMFGGGMAAQANTFNGLLSTFQDNASAAMRAFTGPLFDQAKAGLIQLGNLVQSKAFQDFATTMGQKVGQAIKDVSTFVQTQLVPGFQSLINIGTQVVQFFQNNSDAMETLKTVGVVVASTVITVLVAGFVAWAIAAGSAAIATIAATWPLLAIGAAIGLLVAGFLALYNNSAPFKAFIDGLVVGIKNAWNVISANFMPVMGQLGALLQQVGAFLVATFTPVWNQLVQVWQTQMLPALQQLWAAIQPLMPLFQTIGIIIAGVIVVAFILLIGVLVGVVKAFAGLVSGIAVAVGGIVQFFAGIITAASGFSALLYHLFTGQFDKLGGDLKTIWGGIATMFAGIWNVIKGIFQAAIGLVVGFVTGFITTVVKIFTDLANKLVGHSIIPDMINAIVQWFQGLPGKVLAFITNLITQAINFFTNLKNQAIQIATNLVTGFVQQMQQLPGKAVSAVSGLLGQLSSTFTNIANSATQWGKNVIQNIINGINAMATNVSNAASNIAGQISKNLGFSSPTEEGPGSTADKWAPAFVDMYARGLEAGMPKINAAVGNLIKPIAVGLGTTGGALPSGVNVLPATANTQVTNNITISPEIYLDGRRLTNAQMPYIIDGVRAATGGRF